MKLSIGMMVKNEEKNLERCLKSLQPLRDALDSELIIVDTGSEDTTVEIARRYTDKVYFHPWNNNFSEMRNITISYATGEWFLVMDADEELENTQPIVDFLQSKERKNFGAVAFDGKNFTDENDHKAFSTLLTLHIFRNDGSFHYEGAVHNQPMFQGEVLHIPVTLLHYGYMSTDKELMQKKFERTSTILKSELEKDPENIYYWYQLSVTYGMYKDYSKAVECIEKAYQLYQLKKPENAMYIYTHMAMMYQLSGNYKRVEEVCQESLTIKTGYLDIYYFLAEAQAMHSKKREAIDNYQKYLELLDGYQESSDRDISVVDYTLGYRELVYFNLANLYHNVGEYALAVEYAEKITDVQSIRQNMEITIFSYLKLGQYQQIRQYHDRKVNTNDYSTFYELLEKTAITTSKTTRVAVAEVFKDIKHPYGLLSRMICEDARGKISNLAYTEVNNLIISELPIYCSDIFYYLLKWQYPLEKILVNFKEAWIVHAFDYINKYRSDLSKKLYDYLQNCSYTDNLNEIKLSKLLCRNILLLNNLDDQKYATVFTRYIQDGISYMKTVYTPYIIDNTLVYETKNDEEVFILYMSHAQMNKENNQAEYVKYLRQALLAFPAMKRGVEMLLQNRLNTKNSEKNNEFEMYKQEIKNTVKQLIDKGNMDEAKTILNEYKSIVPNDMEAILLESQILLN